MKIEEVIAHEKFKARIDRIKADKRLFPNNSEYEIFACNRSEAEHENIVLWLEELKELRATSCGYSKEDIELNRNAMYNKAIDDFANVLKENYDYLPQILSQEAFGLYIDEYAERLKEGERE